ncbi:M6 family metalloprotease domain-containing protein [Rhodoferax sp.]|uniref:M6 family metalloprotease domain-containing protein n=1 Tax=Rhodoferax sp. TaxID=50421 RepID=UPI00260D2C03|nr:M6 family metalloprotease domain-containing protein [Rhodoferax sp.]MDD2919821.1 M6 family metalloprotease domain-containing protein [Rhodoferax sp.]
MQAVAVVWIARLVLFFAALMAAMQPAHAGPANPVPQQIMQPDGTTFQAIMQGDEFQGWMETDDGYTVVRNPATGFFEYAQQNPAGELIPSGNIVASSVQRQMKAQGLMPPQGLRPPANTGLQEYQAEFLNNVRASKTPGIQQSDPQYTPALTGTWAPTLVTGTKKILVILVNFKGVSLSSGAASYWNNVVHNPVDPSVATYYEDNSFDALAISPVPHTQVASPAGVVTVTLAQNHPNCGINCSYATESGWINNALAAAAPYVDFAALDTNLNGTISVDETLIYFVLAGYETSAGSGLSPSIWAHAWGGSGVSAGGKWVDHWALNGEMYDATTRMTMGVIAHEMGHAMGGLPDLYDISGTNQGLGVFSLMASGSWGYTAGDVAAGATPVGLDAWSRQYLGWSNPQYPASGSGFTFVSGLASPNASVMLMNNVLSSSEYWLIENRPPVSWDAGMYYMPEMRGWTGGLLIQHIDLNIGTKWANSFNRYTYNPHQGNMAEEPSTALCSLKATSGSSRGCKTILYYSGNSAVFNGTSTPNSNYYSGAASNLGISAISAPGSTMTGTLQTASSTPSYTLSMAKTGTGAGTIISSPAGIDCGATCSAYYTDAPTVTLTATPSAYSTFTGWSGSGCSGTGTCVVSMSAARSVTATFSILEILTVSKTGTGAGTITSSPAGISCGATCSAGYSDGASITLTATPDAYSTFTGWSGSGCSGTGTCVVGMSADQSVAASFDLNPVDSSLSNISTRGRVQTGDSVMIGGFIIDGATAKTVLIRARGPSLSAYGVPGVLANPKVDLYSGPTVIASNDNWGSATNAADITATGLAPTNSLESAILTTLSPGAYTAIVSGVGNTSGVGIVEVLEMDNPAAPLINISTRGQVQTGDNVMIGGFIIDGTGPRTVLIRARGPSLSAYNVPGVLADPMMGVYSGPTVIASNDDWGTATNAADITATGLAPTNAMESAILTTLDPGAYTVIVRGFNNTTGVGIVEVLAQ